MRRYDASAISKHWSTLKFYFKCSRSLKKSQKFAKNSFILAYFHFLMPDKWIYSSHLHAAISRNWGQVYCKKWKKKETGSSKHKPEKIKFLFAANNQLLITTSHGRISLIQRQSQNFFLLHFHCWNCKMYTQPVGEVWRF